jgi:hypothetical protein
MTNAARSRPGGESSPPLSQALVESLLPRRHSYLRPFHRRREPLDAQLATALSIGFPKFL